MDMNIREREQQRGNVGSTHSELLMRCIAECHSCVQACTTCADECLNEPDVESLRQCIRLNLDCADLCLATGKIASRRTGTNEAVMLQLLELCAAACEACAAECERHADHHVHCDVCARECRRCEEACRLAMQDVGGASGRVQTN